MQLSRKLLNSGDTTIDLTEGLIAHYLLNNNADDSHGTYDGTQTDVDFIGDVAAFDGTVENNTSYITTASRVPTDQAFAISLWFTSTQADAGWIANQRTGSTTSREWQFYFYSLSGSGNLSFNVTNTLGTAFNIESTSVHYTDINKVYHIVGLVDGSGNVKLYVDGILEATGAYTGTLATDASNLTIGAAGWGTGSALTAFTGSVSNLRIYNESKDQTFIDALYAEGYYPKPLPLPTVVGLVAHYPLTGTGEDSTGNYDSTDGSSYVDDTEYGSVFSGLGGLTVNSTAVSLSSWCSYWINSGASWTFTKTATIPTVLSGSKYRNLRLYSSQPTISEQDEIEEYEKNFRPIDIDDGLTSYYKLADNSLDNYYSEHDGIDASMTYNGLSGVFNGTSSYINANQTFLPLSDSIASVSLWSNSPHDGSVLFGATSGTSEYAAITNGVVTYGHSTNDRVTFAATANEWINLIVVFKGATSGIDIYKNGVLVASKSETAFSGNSYSPFIGCRNASGTPSLFTNGYIAKLRLYNTTLRPEQAEVIYNIEKGDFI